MRTVCHYQVQFWQEDLLPEEHEFLHLIIKVLQSQKQVGSGKILVHCMDGCTRSGLFLAVFNVLQRMEAAKNINIPWGILTIKETQQNFISDIDQLRYIYSIVRKHLENI